ncbi:MAG TPA: pitrilysin family protein, partial [Acidobacteriota bacterium]|nr:pitrilysin family protein [Acidobacteriota bacterium]
AKLRLALDNAKETLRRQNDSPRRIVAREFARLLYGDHPYGRFPTEATLDAITRDDVVAFYRRDFHPNTTILAVSGSISEADLRRAVAGAFGNWMRTAVVPPTIPDLSAPQTGYFQINKDISQTNIRFGHVGIDRHDPDRHAIRVLNHILGGGGFTSRMMGTVRSDSGLAYSVGTDFTLPDQPGMFYAACQTKSEGTAKTLSLMQWVIADLLAEGITENELATAKESILNSDVFKYVTPVGIVERYAGLEYYGFPSDQLKKDVEAIGAVTAADVEAAASKHLHPENYTVLAVGPIEKFEAALAPAGNVKTLEIE